MTRCTSLKPPRGITEVRNFFFPPFFLFFFFSLPRSSTGFLYSHAIPRHNSSPRLPFSSILPFLFFFFVFFSFSHHGPRPGSSILMPSQGITGVRDFLSNILPSSSLFFFIFPHHGPRRVYLKHGIRNPETGIRKYNNN